MATLVGARLQGSTSPGSLGVVTATFYVRCFWPALDRPTRLFADGSSGLKVMGPPTPRNVVFPADTEFVQAVPDGFYPAEQALFAAFPNRRAVVMLSEEEVAVYMAAYEDAVGKMPETATKTATRHDCCFLRHKVNVAPEGRKPNYDHYICEISYQEALDLCDRKVDETEMRIAKHGEFKHMSDPMKLLSDAVAVEDLLRG